MEVAMVVDREKIERLEKELEEAKRELLREDGERYRILMREISNEEKERILGTLTDRGERILFGLEAPELKRGAVQRPGGAGGELTCEICGKRGLTALGLKLHTARLHKPEMEKEGRQAA
jgi:hypothetical protein